MCELDSDGDGKSNGMELGDPSCSWTAASDNFPERLTGITHPGEVNPESGPHVQVVSNVCGSTQHWALLEICHGGLSNC